MHWYIVDIRDEILIYCVIERMSWFYESFSVPSEINGPIEVKRLFGQWNISAGGNGQVNGYLKTLWKKAIKEIPRTLPIRKVLMLGLATGGTIPLFLKRFPNASITAIEIDPVMIELMQRCGSVRQADRLRILTGDAAKMLPTLQEKYDLVIFDMFAGTKVAPVTREAEFIRQALCVTEKHGAWLVNAYLEPDILDVLRGYCGEQKCWKYLLNHVGLFRPWGSGTTGDPLPEDYIHFSLCDEYLQRQYRTDPDYERVYAGPTGGLRRTLGPLCFDHYVGDDEPINRPSGTHKFMTFWQPITRTKAPPGSGWKWFPLPGGRMLTGFSLIPPSGPYHEAWSEHAKRHRTKWLKQTTHEIVEADVPTYLAAFARCGKPSSLIRIFSREVARKNERHPGMLRLRVARAKDTQEIVAGFASLWIPEIKQTFHLTSFITKAGTQTSAAFGLVDDCFRLSQERGCRVLEFDGFWTFGSPLSWKGFSRFKSQFNVYYVRWPHPFIRFD